MDIAEQLRQYAQSLRDRGVSREEATRLVEQERSRLMAQQPSPAEQPSRREERPEDEGLTMSQRARLLGQGAAFGFGEEIEGLVRGAAALVPGGKSPSEAYRETVERAREDIEQAYERAPVQAFLTEMGGGLAPSLLAAPFTGGGSLAALGARGAAAAPRAASAARAARAASRWSAARPVVGGAIEGAISGAGVGEEDLGNRLQGAVLGAGIGAATGGALRLAGAGVRRGAELIDNVRMQREAASRSAGYRATGIPISQEEAFSEIVAERRPPIPTRAAVERVEEALLGQGIEPRRASEFAREGQRVMELGIPVSELEAMEAGMLPSSAAATPIQRIARSVSVGGGEPAERLRTTIAQRLKDSPDRIKGEVTKRVLGERSPYLRTLDSLTETRKANAAELYDTAYQGTIPAPVLSRFISRPPENNWFVDIYRKAQELARMEVAAGFEDAEELPEIFRLVTKGKKTSYRTIQGTRVPVRALDYIQRTIDSEIDRLSSRGDINQQVANVLRVEKENLLDLVGSKVPAFAEARRVYRGDSANLEALNAAYNGGEVFIGRSPMKMRSFLQETPGKVRRFLTSNEVSESEKQSYITGALESLLERADKVAGGRDLTRALIGDKATADKVKLLLGSEENFRGFLEAMLPERGLKSLEAKALGGSTTAEKSVDVSRQRGLETATSLLSGAGALAARIFAGAIEEAERRFTRAARTRAQRATEAELLAMSPRALEEFYRDVYEPMLRPSSRPVELGAEALRRALVGQLSRMQR